MFSYAAVIAIMRANCVYVPLNPKAPAERLLKTIDDAGIEGVIVDTTDALTGEVTDALRRSQHLHIITNDGHSFPSLDRSHASSDGTLVTSPRLAYIIYTSGSTGEPKGVAIAHESACHCMEKLHQLFEANERDRFTQFSALSFDYSLVELFVCWKAGGALYVPAASEALVPLSFAVTHEITVWFSVPSLASFIVKLGLLKRNVLPSVRLLLFGGEALPFELAQVWAAAAPFSRILNLYGPTEVTIVSTYREYQRQSGSRSGTVPIGLPLPGLHYMIVDDGRAVEMDDVPGELWSQLDDTLPRVWYRTGDLVSRQSGVGVSFRGRIDRQVKLRGFRVELQEIESVLRDVIGCALVAVVPVRNAGGMCERIFAYCDRLSSDEATIKCRCLSRIPPYMVPERILELDTFPISAHGKIDYVALGARMANPSH
jgi:non-ribosomal peptide synthetase component F